MSVNNNGEVKAPVFTGENYDFWSIKMKTIFKPHDLWDLMQEDCVSSKAGGEGDKETK